MSRDGEHIPSRRKRTVSGVAMLWGMGDNSGGWRGEEDTSSNIIPRGPTEKSPLMFNFFLFSCGPYRQKWRFSA